ncbi:helix-turn-helix transcriptional regulator [Clostridium botulinum]|nr:helix-turn-helix transcriptional regulator [Clostridium botulinum]
MKPHEKSKEIRINKNITTYELSELIGTPQPTISKVENSKRKIKIGSS